MKTNKGLANVVLIIVVLLVGILAGYFFANMKKGDKNFVVQNGETETNVQCSQINWQTSLPQIQNIITTEFGDGGSVLPINIVEEVDLTGDGCTEAVVTTGGSGAYVEELTLMREDGNNPIIAKLKNNNGQVDSVLIGAGASVRNQVGYKTLPQQNGFYSFQKNIDEQGGQMILAGCSVDAYVWNNSTKIFEYNSNLVQSVMPLVCVL